ncbi:MAG: type II toxin-antitoxin system HicB family antitoxin, partial [Nitrosopumilus sp.]
MHNEFTCIIEKDEDWFISYCPEIPVANGQGRTIEECRKILSEAIALILKNRKMQCGAYSGRSFNTADFSRC